MTANGGSQISSGFVGIRFSDAAPQCPDDLAIIVTLRAAGEDDFTVSLSSDGVELNFVPPSDLYSKKYISPQSRDSIELHANVNREGAVHVVDLPEQQQLLIGDLPMDMTVVIDVLRMSRQRTVLTNRASIELGTSAPEFEVASEFASGSRKKLSLPALPSLSWLPYGRRALKVVTFSLLSFLVVVMVTPLNVVHPSQPDSQAPKLAVVWSASEPTVGQVAIIAISDQDTFLGEVAQTTGDSFIVKSDSSYAQATLPAYLGRVLFTIPLVGFLAP
jgi:hypothetical protein